MKSDDEWGTKFFHDVCFSNSIFQLLFRNQFSLVQHFQGIKLVRPEVPSQINLPKGSTPNLAENLKIFVRD